ncbi:MAG TPA: FecR domain-containing protein [Spirochaetota bacterium]|nr:FecR domain-containing protein [Spirochaetota bacterium]HOD14217.1 FecR domain-containing protein [Spirochaetota bacterium]HPG51245.1 FecR domain-containing protein [Spirochaetota bacterium]HPN11723.1 FecR domain-containing protein [Spirochaetota bacterium]HQL82932.1 FecR domain-containing protein [Spirochaetota bacterium]
MKLSKVEFSVYTAAAVILCVFSTLFYFDFTSKPAVGQERIVGSIAFKKRVAQRKFASQVVWEDIEQKEPVYNNDTIRTSNASETVIRLVDGTEIMVNENSMILLSLTTDEIDIQFRGGSISAKRGDLGDDKLGALNITSGDTTVSLDKSDVQVSGGKDRGINLTVNRGEAKVTAGDTVKRVGENQKVIVAADAKKIDVISIPVRPISPLPDSVIVTKDMTTIVTFTWEPLGPEQDAFIEVIGEDTDTINRVVRKIEGNSLVLGLPPGTYNWHLTAKNRKTGAMDESGTRKVTIVRDLPARLMSPVNGQVFNHAGDNPIISFTWTGGDNVQQYELWIATDPGMKSVVRIMKTPDSRIAVDSLGPGTYYWQVHSLIKVGNRSSRTMSGARMFAVAKTTITDPPRPLFPADGGTVRSAVIMKKGVLFSWKKSEDIPHTILTLSKDSSFRSVVYTGRSSLNVLTVRTRLAPGMYYWNVTGLLSNRKLTRPSDSMRFTVSDNDSIRLISPVNAAEFRMAGATGTIRFTWEQPETYGDYTLQVARSRDFGTVMREERVQGGSAVISKMPGGTYYWRVLLRSGEGGLMMSSSPYSITVRELLSEPTITSPRRGEIIDFDKMQEVNLSWKTPDNANTYRLRFYRLENERAQLVSERTLNATAMEINDMNFLGEGKFMFTVQAFETSLGSEKILRESPVSRTYFEIRLNKIVKKPKIITPKVLYLE